MKLYRYRTIESALLELENGSFYFAAPTELNDPICSWRHDFTPLRKKNFLNDLQNKILLSDIHQFDYSPLSQIFKELGENFWATSSVQTVGEFYGNNEIKCYGRELEFILRTVTDDACRLCVRKCKDLGLIRAAFDEKFFDVAYEISFDELKNVSDAERKRRI